MSQEAEYLVDRRSLKRRLTLWRALAVTLVVLGIIFLIPWGDEKDEPHIARVHISAVIVDDLERSETLSEIAEDEDVKGVIVYINSPGGTVAGSEALFRDLRDLAAEKPMVSFISTLGASGGYLAAVGSDHIVARETALTGSIGVIFRSPEISGLMDKIGVGLNELKVGEVKGDPSPYRPMDETARAALQATLDESYDWFVGLVAERRGMSFEEMRPLADGRVYTGGQAAANGLVDETGGEADALSYLGGKGVDTDVEVVDYLHEDYEPGLLGQAMRLFGFPAERESSLALDGLLALWHP